MKTTPWYIENKQVDLWPSQKEKDYVLPYILSRFAFSSSG